MRIGLLSDTHGNTKAVDQAVKMAGDIDLWLHAGDNIEDAEYLKMAYEVAVINVAGNCDWGDSKTRDEEIIELPGHKIFLTHGHKYGIKSSPYTMVKTAQAIGADIAVFGHSHVAFHENIDGVLLINPGSLSFPRDGEAPSFMVMEINSGQEPEIYHYHVGNKKGRWFRW